MKSPADAARAGTLPPVLLVRGDRVVAEPLALRLAAEVGEAWGVAPHRLASAEQLPAIVADLRTVALFEPGKISVAVETGLLADKSAAAELLAPVLKELKRSPFSGGPEELHGPLRDGARRLLQVVRLYDLDPGGDPERVLAKLPAAILAGDKPVAGATDEARARLLPLLAAAVAAGLRGEGDEELSLVGDLVRDGLPDRHLLVMVESAVAEKHPLVLALAKREAIVEAGRVAARKDGFDGLEAVVAELERETGVRIRRDAAEELARRTLLAADERRGEAGLDADSIARFAAEARKLASLSTKGVVDRAAVVEHVEDRGQEDVWAVLDALGKGDAAGAIAKAERRLRAADDPERERLALFALLAGFARQLVAVRGVLAATGARGGEESYPRFKDRVAPLLQGEVDGLAVNPLAKLHPYRLHRAYLAASRFPAERLAALPARTLETERRLKGDASDPGAALATYLVELAGLRPGPGPRGGSRARGGGGGRS